MKSTRKKKGGVAVKLNTLGIAHKIIEEKVCRGNFCIDATAGRGHDTAFLCGLVGDEGRVLAMDIQQDAVDSTRALLQEKGYDQIAQVVLDSHSNIDHYAQPETVDCITFNFGYLPGGDHNIFTTPATSIPAIEKGLELLKPGGLMSLCVYYGGDSGFEEKDALMQFFKTIDSKRFTVLITEFANRPNNPPIPVFILKQI